MTDRRPSPDALLKQASTQGRLKIFLGAAPGVGKTYEMLTAAHARVREGIDVVAAIVETHGRAETAALLENLETLPRRQLPYKDHQLEEMDLDAVLARRPTLALVDELAHTNAPGSRHPKRYQDVEELLAAGIDVYTTLNIQHVESLNDVVARITRIRVRETVPDSIIDRADAIELIDLTPDDLMQRLREGKIYLPKTASRALTHYFSPGNLTALRELALRRTAQRVDAQLLDHMQAHAIPGPWAAGERVLVCVTRTGAGPELVRYGRRLAEQLRAPWTALHVETPATLRLAQPDRDRIADTMRLAARLGAETATIPGSNVPADILAYARDNNFAHIVVGHPAPSRLSWLRPSIVQALLSQAADIPIHVIGRPLLPLPASRDGEGGWAAPTRGPSRPLPYLAALATVACAILLGIAMREILAVSSISLVFLTAVLAVASTIGLGPALAASVASALAYNFFFLPPLYTFTVADPENVVALAFFIIVSVIASRLAGGVRAGALAAAERARTTEALYAFSGKLAGIVSLDDLLWATAHQVAAMLKLRVVLLLPDGDTIAVRAGYPPEDALDPPDLAAAQWCWQHNREAGRGADTLPGARRLFIPMRTAAGKLGVIGLDNDATGPLLTPDQRRLLDALIDQAAVSIERVNLATALDRARLHAETERLRGALLTSLSHDLRTPLAAILGAASSLATYGDALDAPARADLLASIGDEAERLNRFVANLLDMTRLESGAVALKREPTDLGEVIGTTLARAARILDPARITLAVAPDLPLLNLDPILMEQALFNLLDNAAKYAPPESRVTLRAWRDGASVKLQIIDEGTGIAQGAEEKIFEKFFRVHAADRQRPGTGLGLAVCRGFIDAMGGTIAAANRTDANGAVFTITLPVP